MYFGKPPPRTPPRGGSSRRSVYSNPELQRATTPTFKSGLESWIRENGQQRRYTPSPRSISTRQVKRPPTSMSEGPSYLMLRKPFDQEEQDDREDVDMDEYGYDSSDSLDRHTLVTEGPGVFRGRSSSTSSSLEDLREREFGRLMAKDERDLFDLKGRNLTPEQVMKALATVDRFARAIDLSENGLAAIPLLPTKLCVLSISHNKLTNLKDLEMLTNLKELDVSHNQLKSLRGLFRSHNLETLNAGNNQLTCVSGLETLLDLRHLDLSNNKLPNVSRIRALSCNVKLTELRMEGNPITNLSTFRQLVMDLVPSLVALDQVRVSCSPQIQSDAGRKNWSYSTMYASRKSQKQEQQQMGKFETVAVAGEKQKQTPKKDQKKKPRNAKKSSVPPPARAIAHAEIHGPKRMSSQTSKLRKSQTYYSPIKVPVKEPGTTENTKKKTFCASPLDRIGSQFRAHALGNDETDSLDIAFDDEFEEPQGRRIVEQMKSQHTVFRADLSTVDDEDYYYHSKNDDVETPRYLARSSTSSTSTSPWRISQNNDDGDENDEALMDEIVIQKIKELLRRKKESLRHLKTSLGK